MTAAKDKILSELRLIRAELERLNKRVDLLYALNPAKASPEPLESLDLTRKTKTCLRKAGIVTIGQLTAQTREELGLIKNCGKTALADIEAALHKKGLFLKCTL